MNGLFHPTKTTIGCSYIQIIYFLTMLVSSNALADSTLTIDGNLTVKEATQMDGTLIVVDTATFEKIDIEDTLGVKNSSLLMGDVFLGSSLNLSDKSIIVGLQVAESDDCSDSAADSGTTCKISGTWNFCALSKLYLDAEDDNADHIECSVSGSANNWTINARFDNGTSGKCKARCMNLSAAANPLKKGVIPLN